jgi:hypothetical protein
MQMKNLPQWAIVALLLLVGGIWLQSKRSHTAPLSETEKPLVPGLLDNINKVDGFKLTRFGRFAA